MALEFFLLELEVSTWKTPAEVQVRDLVSSLLLLPFCKEKKKKSKPPEYIDLSSQSSWDVQHSLTSTVVCLTEKCLGRRRITRLKRIHLSSATIVFRANFQRQSPFSQLPE